jgi:hypothetical protein
MRFSNGILARARADFSLLNAREQVYPMTMIHDESLNSERSGTIHPNPRFSYFSCGLDDKLTVAGSRYKSEKCLYILLTGGIYIYSVAPLPFEICNGRQKNALKYGYLNTAQLDDQHGFCDQSSKGAQAPVEEFACIYSLHYSPGMTMVDESCGACYNLHQVVRGSQTQEQAGDCIAKWTQGKRR